MSSLFFGNHVVNSNFSLLTPETHWYQTAKGPKSLSYRPAESELEIWARLWKRSPRRAKFHPLFHLMLNVELLQRHLNDWMAATYQKWFTAGKNCSELVSIPRAAIKMQHLRCVWFKRCSLPLGMHRKRCWSSENWEESWKFLTHTNKYPLLHYHYPRRICFIYFMI